MDSILPLKLKFLPELVRESKSGPVKPVVVMYSRSAKVKIYSKGQLEEEI